MTTDTLIAGTDTTQQAGDQTIADPKVDATGTPAVDATKTDQPDATAATKTDPKADAPIEYEFKLPEGTGLELDPKQVETFKALAKEAKLPPEMAQKFVDLAAQREVEAVAKRDATIAGWAESVKTDKEIGGDKLTETLAHAKKAIELGPPELKDLLNTSGLGNHPAVVKWAATVGKALSEDRFVTGSTTPAGTEKSVAQRLYPNT